MVCHISCFSFSALCVHLHVHVIRVHIIRSCSEICFVLLCTQQETMEGDEVNAAWCIRFSLISYPLWIPFDLSSLNDNNGLCTCVPGPSSLFPMEDERSFGDDERSEQSLGGLGSPHCFPHQNGERIERYSRKVFVGGLPPDIDEGNMKAQPVAFILMSILYVVLLPPSQFVLVSLGWLLSYFLICLLPQTFPNE